jgi:glutamyl-tRNA reductase
VANRTWDRAVEVAGRLGGEPVRLDDLPHHLVEVDMLLTSTGASAVILEHGDLASVVGERHGRELLVVDIAVPRDVDPAAGEIDGLTLLDMDDLREFAEVGIRERQREVTAVQVIVDAELDRYLDESTARSVAPLVASLRARGDLVRSGELQRLSARLGDLDDLLWERQGRATRFLILRLDDVDLTLARPDGDEKHIGGGAVSATLTGEPCELVLFLVGRRDHAVVEVTGDHRAVAEIRTGPLAI